MKVQFPSMSMTRFTFPSNVRSSAAVVSWEIVDPVGLGGFVVNSVAGTVHIVTWPSCVPMASMGASLPGFHATHSSSLPASSTLI